MQITGIATRENKLKDEYIDEGQSNTYGYSHRYFTPFSLLEIDADAQKRHDHRSDWEGDLGVKIHPVPRGVIPFAFYLGDITA